MRSAGVVVAMLGLSALFLSGCATTMGSKVSGENADLKIQVQNLQAQLQQKDAEIDSLRKSLSSTTEERYASAKTSRYRGETLAHPTVKDIQTALKNAGYDPGEADGKMGGKTRKAIRDFQKANALDADGKVGKKTWSLLVLYLEKSGK